VPFLFCDSAQIIDTMREVLPALVVRPKQLLARGQGPLHQFDRLTAHCDSNGGVRGGAVSNEITRQMFVELELMQRCSGLVYMDSGFSILSRIKLEDGCVSRLFPNRVNMFIGKVARRLLAH